MRNLNFKLITLLVLSVFIILGYGCSEEDMIKPEPLPQPIWKATNNVIDGHILSMSFNADDNLFVLLQENRKVLFYTKDGGVLWAVTDTVNVDTMLYTVRSFAFNDSDDLFVGTKEGLVFSSSDNGDSLAVVDTLGYGLFVDMRGIIAPENDLYVAVSGSGVYHSEDNGQSWINIGADLENKDFIYNGLITNPAGDIYLACWGGAIYKTDNKGVEWTSLNPYVVGYFPKSINSLAFREDGKIISGGNGFYCYYETDTAKVDSSMWINQNYGLPETVDVRCIELASDGTIYIGTYNDGVFRSSNNGASWESISAGLPDLQIQDIAIRSDGRIFVATFSNGIFYNIW